jgi:hypothetical protein
MTDVLIYKIANLGEVNARRPLKNSSAFKNLKLEKKINVTKELVQSTLVIFFTK